VSVTQASSLWRTILPGLLVGLIVTMLAMFGSVMMGFSGLPHLILMVLLVAAIAVAVQIPKHRMLSISMIVGGLLGVVASWVIFFALFSDGFFNTRTEENLTAPQLEQWIGMDFSSSATNLHSYAEGFQDWQVFVRFEMPKSDVKEFLRINKLEPESNTITYFSNDDLKKDWWKPETNTPPQVFKPMVKDGTETQPTTKTGFYPSVQISDLKGGLVTVYISAFNT
jgi:hypothetical protein